MSSDVADRPANPALYEINTRVWLRELGEPIGVGQGLGVERGRCDAKTSNHGKQEGSHRWVSFT